MVNSSEVDFFDFGEDNEVLEPAPEEGIVQWYSSRDCEAVGEGGELEDSTTAGWHIQIGKYPYLDKACEKAQCRKVYLEQTSGKNGYWQVGKNGGAHFFVLAKGCHSETEMNDKTKRAGIAYGWNKDKDGKNIKTLKFRAFVKELLPFFDEENPPKPVIVVVKKGFANDLLPILGREGHHRVLKANDQGFLEKHGKPTKTPYWGIALFLGPGKKIKRMNKDKSLGSVVSPIVSDIPAVITPDFLASHHVGYYLDLIRDEIKASNYSIEWSLQTSQEIYVGANGNEEEGESFVASPSQFDEECYDHPFDDSGSYDETYPDKPQAKQPSNGLKRLSDAELGAIPGTANLGQRRALQNLGLLELAQTAGLTREKAGKEITDAQPKKR